MRKRYGRKTDHNQKEVVELLKGVGAVPIQIEEPVDLLIGFRGKWYLAEVKNKSTYGTLTPQQEKFLELCEHKRLPFRVIYSGQEALEFIGAVSAG